MSRLEEDFANLVTFLRLAGKRLGSAGANRPPIEIGGIGRPAMTSLLLICHSYPPMIGGSELEAQRVCAALIRRGYRVTVVCAGGDPMPPVRDWIDPHGVPVRIYAARWRGVVKDFVFGLRVAGMLISERRNYQLVYFLMHGFHLAAGLPVARFLGKSIVMKVGGSGVIPMLTRSPTGRTELSWLRKWSHRVMILNEGMRAEALQEGFPAEQILWMPNPVDTDEFAPADSRERDDLRARFGIPVAAQVVLYSGRLAPEKALPSLLDALSLVVQKMPEAVLVLVGDGPLRASLVAQSKKLNLPAANVHFAGRVKPEEVNSWLKIADTFALVSPSEGFSCALAEAMSAALPSVVSDIPANRQLIDAEKHGLLIPSGNVNAIAAAILRLFEDNVLRRRMGDAARRRVLENYSTAKVADRYETLFAEALRNG